MSSPLRRALSLALVTSLAVCGCGGPAAEDDAGSDAADDAAPACRADVDCDDGLFCNGVERCGAGTCESGTIPGCDDGVACTVDGCSEATRACVHRVPDEDGDGAGDAACVDGTGTALGTDCDDADANRYPGNRETCDAAGHDEDCDATTHGGVDADGDGFVDARCCNGSDCGDDCDDGHATAHPGATEVCNLVDDDCDGAVDQGVSTSGFVDADRDGYGDPSMPLSACSTRAGFAATGDDCDDASAARNPGQPEFCDGVDNDCDTSVDESASAVTWYRDGDGDGFGSAASGTLSACAPPAGYALRGSDCDDARAAVSPAAPELCNGIDDDCNGAADYVIASGDLEDDDLDGIADAQCGAPLGLDCDDRDATSSPGTLEACDGRDNDCDGRIDEGATEVAFYRDADGDGFGDARAVRVGCTQPVGYARRAGDCDDADAQRGPSAAERCNASDDDCDGATDESPASTECASMPGTVMACRAGACTPIACELGWGDCTSALGCESNVLSDPSHCGSCAPCARPFSTCGAGVCGPALSGPTALQTDAGDVVVERVLSVPASTDYILAGRFTGTLHLGTSTLTSAGGYDGFAARMRSDGSAAWAAQWGGTGFDAIHAIAMTPTGNALVVGGELCDAPICGGPVSGCVGFHQRFADAASPGCNYAEVLTGAPVRALAMEQVAGNFYVYVAGAWAGTSPVGFGTAQGNDAYVYRAREVVSSQPVHEWTRTFTGLYDEIPEDLALDGASNLVVVGYTASSADFAHGPTAHAGYDDAFLANLDRATGTVGTAAQFGTSSGYDRATRVVALPSGGVALTGYFSYGTLVWGGLSVTASGSHDLFLFAGDPSTWTASWGTAIDGDVDPGGLAVAGTRVVLGGQFAYQLPLAGGSLYSFDHSAFVLGLEQASGAIAFARASAGSSLERSGGVAVRADGRLVWEIEHASGLVVDGQTLAGGSDTDLAVVVVTP